MEIFKCQQLDIIQKVCIKADTWGNFLTSPAVPYSQGLLPGSNPRNVIGKFKTYFYRPVLLVPGPRFLGNKSWYVAGNCGNPAKYVSFAGQLKKKERKRKEKTAVDSVLRLW